ncbi:MAG: MOSC domain-containing protein [Paracoccaceae bacterium]|nr:MOSC domain-containing protein [Paracoccaceae bacterium]
MTARVAQIWRHPIKSHGREAMGEVMLEAGRTLPGDRAWAVAHEAARLDFTAPAWAPCANFSRGSKAPGLMAINARFDEAAGRLTLTHPDREALSFDPDDPADEARFIAWVTPLCPADRALPARLYKVAGRGMTDTDFPSISLNSLASHEKVAARIGRPLSPQRWRGNVLFEGLPAWEEFTWVGRRLSLGAAEIEVRERIERCLATAASTRTGIRDADTLGALEQGWGHRDFGVYAVVTRGGTVRPGDRIEIVG